jgi:hypothetical protein
MIFDMICGGIYVVFLAFTSGTLSIRGSNRATVFLFMAFVVKVSFLMVFLELPNELF